MSTQRSFDLSFSVRLGIVLVIALLTAACQIRPPSTAPANATNQGTVPAQGTIPAQAMEPLPAEQAKTPIQVAIPALSLEAPIVPMGWTVTDVNGQRTTQWSLPADALGWHINSAGSGAVGRVILSGQQAVGVALLAPLARGEVAAGQEVLLTDSDGLVFVYRITEVSEPIVLADPSAEEQAQTAAYVAPSEEALLTLITGWPDFTTTHRVFAVAELVGLQE